MRFRSHIGRPFDMANPWNQVILILTVVVGAIGAFLTVVYDRDLVLAFQAGGATFLSWALGRELDPDRQVSAVIAGVVGATWALIGLPIELLPFAALLMVSRLLVETTGRRPLGTDLAAMVFLAVIVSFTATGWVMGFGLAVTLYVDDRLAEEHSRQAILAAVAAAVGAAVVANLAGAFPESPTVRPLFAATLGVLALLAVVREPVEPVSFVDSRNKRFLRRDRLHAGRAAVGVLLFVAALLAGEMAAAVAPMALVLTIAMASTELERVVRSRPRN